MDAIGSSSFDGDDDGSSAEDFTNVEEEERVLKTSRWTLSATGYSVHANGLVRRQLSIRKRKKRHFTGFRVTKSAQVEHMKRRPVSLNRPGFRRPGSLNIYVA